MVRAPQSRRVRTEEPVDLALTFGSLVRGAYDPTSHFMGDEWWRAWNTPGGTATTRLVVARPDGAVDVTAWGDGAAWVLDHADDWLGENDDPAAFEPRDAVVAPIARRLPGLRLTCLRATYDVAIATVVEQRVTTIEARRTWARLVRRHGERAPGPVDLRVAPAPRCLAALADHARHAVGLELRRGRAASCVAGEAGRLDRAATRNDGALATRLRSLPGIGPWTTATVVHFVQGDADAVPIGDWHLPSMVAWALAGERRADDARMLELLEPFRPHRARAWRLIVAGAPMPPRRVPRARIENLLQRERTGARA
jgi:3-methyladenine DNA glycosylase/8-oxoguanine DNA glycosylase